jgi:ABC-2 type transport system permease protein
LYRSLRVLPTLTYLAELKGMARSASVERAEELLVRFDLGAHRRKKIQELSRGLGQFVLFAETIMHRPEFIVLDEPFSGLDPVNKGRLIFFFAIAVALIVSTFTTSGDLLQGLNEEKENRIMEVLLSSVRPEQLMLGKLVGLGGAGLAQVLVWTLSGVGFIAVLDAMVSLPEGLVVAPSVGALAIALVYFVRGYFFFGTLMAALDAVTTSQREAGQVTFPVVLPGVAPFWFMEESVSDPEGLVSRVLSLIPFTAPLVGLVRLSVDGMSVVDLMANLAVLAVSVALAMVLTVRLSRAYLLMFGQRPSLGQIFRTLRGA